MIRRSHVCLIGICCGIAGVQIGRAEQPEKSPQHVEGSQLMERVFIEQFSTGYEEGETTTNSASEVGWMTFQNTSRHPDASPWAMSVFYEVPGTVGDRYARVIDDPTTDQPNRVLHYWLKNAVIPSGFRKHTKGRIQTGFPGQLAGAVEVYSRQRVYLHEDINHLLEYPPDADPWWRSMTLQEFWMGADWEGHPNPSRISLLMFPYQGKMYLGLDHQAMPELETIWHQTQLDISLPVGEWFMLEIGYKSGDAENGRMVIAVTTEKTGQRDLMFDESDWTYDPEADEIGGTGPVTMTHWNPQKLYSSDNMIHFIRDRGGVAQVYFDDFAFSSMWPANWPD